MDFDAWDIDIYYQEKMRVVDHLVEAVVEETGPVRGVLRLHWRFANSDIIQRLTIYRASPRIDFKTEVEWHQQQVLLKVAFPVAIRATHATYDIQMGSIERPTHWNTSWDYARFEGVGHKWVDLSEGDYGVGLLNDCKYGHDVKDHTMRLTLIKSAKYPDETADQGKHIFTYSVLPHMGDWRQGKVVEEAYQLNVPLLAGLVGDPQPGDQPPAFSLAELDSDHVILETVKRTEDADGSWIFRVYEFQQRRSSAVTLRFGRPVKQAAECNLVEEGAQTVATSDREISFPILPYEIKTFKVWFE
jgi:alpha-mannosidase